MLKLKNTVALFICFLFIYNISSQEKEKSHQKEPNFELVLSGLSIYDVEHKTSDLATEVHLTYWTTHKWAFGVGYTLIFEESNQTAHELAALVSHKPWSFLTVNAGPSFSLPNSHRDTEVSAYLESEFAFKIGKAHSGPTVGILAGKETKLFYGWHFSYEF